MEPVNFQMPGYRINEYLLVLKPQEELWQKILKVKEGFADKYQLPSARYLKPHIALVNFITLDMMEEKIIQRFQATAMGMAPFKVELRDYGSFPSHTIFINVVTKLPIQNLVKQLKESQRILKLNQETRPHFIEEPHIGIARKLKPWQYEQGWLDFSNRQFTGRFIADSMLLLKRKAGEKSAFQVARRFDFMNLPVVTRQGNLFNTVFAGGA
ncbi:MAG TPA: 2'-5' RNA ligase family protein [Flavisolibacter sp.]